MMDSSFTKPVRVAILGYGVIGRRVADAVHAQPDMEVVGVAGRPTSFSLRDAALLHYPVYLTRPVNPCEPADRLYSVAGSFSELLDQSDVLLDCTPSGIPSEYADVYEKRKDLLIIVQGGEKHEFGGVSFNSFTNYAGVKGCKRVRVISCSTTGITRFLYPLHHAFGVRDAHVMLARRASDPAKRSKVPFNAVLPVMGWSHHAKDVGTVLPSVQVTTVAVLAPTTRAHVLTFKVELESQPGVDKIVQVLNSFPRIVVGSGLSSTIDIVEHFQDAGFRRNDFPGIYVWRDGIEMMGRELHASVAVHMESITIPETVDCIRAALGMEPKAWASIWTTDVAMGIAREERCYEHQ